MWVSAGCWSTARGILETISPFSARPCHIQCLFIGRPQTYCSHMRAWGQGKDSEKITNLLYKFWNPVWFAKAPSPFRTSSKTKETRKAWWQIRPDVCSTFGGKLPLLHLWNDTRLRIWIFAQWNVASWTQGMGWVRGRSLNTRCEGTFLPFQILDL